MPARAHVSILFVIQREMLVLLMKKKFATNKLNGTLPSSLSNLASLQYLHLYENSLEGPLPTEIGGIVNLVELHLFRNEIGGYLPTEIGYIQTLGARQGWKIYLVKLFFIK